MVLSQHKHSRKTSLWQRGINPSGIVLNSGLATGDINHVGFNYSPYISLRCWLAPISGLLSQQEIRFASICVTLPVWSRVQQLGTGQAAGLRGRKSLVQCRSLASGATEMLQCKRQKTEQVISYCCLPLHGRMWRNDKEIKITRARNKICRGVSEVNDLILRPAKTACNMDREKNK